MFFLGAERVYRPEIQLQTQLVGDVFLDAGQMFKLEVMDTYAAEPQCSE